MDHVPVSVNIHGEEPSTPFRPKVHPFKSSGEEYLAVEFDVFVSLLLSRKRLHQLTHVLVTACSEHPLPIEEV